MIQRRSYQILLVFVIFAFVGVALLPQLSIQLNPSKSSGSLVVSYTLPNASPEVLEQQVTAKLEAAFSTLQGIKKLLSNSSYTSGYVTIELEKGTDLDQIRFEVAMLIRQLYPKLPKEISYPNIQLNSPQENTKQESFITLQLSGNTESNTLSNYANEQLKPTLASIEGIYEINIYGSNGLEWIIEYQQSQLEALGIKEEDLVVAIQQNFKKESLGISQNASGNQINVILENQNTDLNQWKIPVKNPDNRIIYLTDLAKLSQQERPISQFYRINGNNALNIVLVADAGANQIKLSEQVRQKITAINAQNNGQYQLTVEYDASEYIVENLQKISIQAGLAILILLIFIWLTVRAWWYVGLISLSLLINLAISFAVFYFLKIEIHLYSLAALTTSLGIIIDNAIVMIDHYQRYKNLKIFMSLLGATLTTAAGLVAIFFLPEENRLDLTDFTYVMLITLLASLPMALFFIPAFLERAKIKTKTVSRSKNPRKIKTILWLKKVYFSLLSFLLKFRKTAFVVAILCFGFPVFLIPDKIDKEQFGSEIYNNISENEWFQENGRPFINKWLGGTLRLFTQYVYESSYYQSPERTILYIYAQLPNNSTIEQMNDVFLQLENIVAKHQEITQFVTNINNAQNGMLSIYFSPEAEENGFAYHIKSEVIQISTEMSGIDWDIYGVGQGFSQNVNDAESPSFNIKMQGYNYNELEREANKLKEMLEKHPRIQEVNINKSLNWYSRKSLFEFALNTNDERLTIMGIQKNLLAMKLQQLNIKPQSDLYLMLNNDYLPVKVQPSESKNQDLWQLDNSLLKQDSTFVKMKDFTKITKRKVLPEILKEDQQYLRMVNFTYFGSNVFGEKFLDKTLQELNLSMPIGYKAENMTHSWQTEENQKQFWLIGMVLLLIYVVCAIIFESLLQPLALILIIPLSFIGVFLTFYIFDFNFDQGGYASFILLSGNVVCAAIFIISEYNILQKKLPNAQKLLLFVKAFNHKVLPILSTVLSTIVGLIPFLIYGEKEPFWFAFGVGTIGGLLMSLIIIPLYLPLFLKLKNNINLN